MSEKTISLSELYNAYVETNEELQYDNALIERMVIRPNNQKALQRSLCRRAGVPVKDTFTSDDFIAIVDDTNKKYELYKNGPYTDNLKNQGVSRYCMFSNILYGMLIKLDMSDIAEGLLYCNNKIEVEESESDTFGRLADCIKTAEDFVDNVVLSEDTMENFESVTEELIKVLHEARKEVGDAPNDLANDLLTRGDTVRERLLASLDLYNETLQSQPDTEVPVEQQATTEVESAAPSQGFVSNDMIHLALKEIPELLQKGHEATVELEKVKAELEELKRHPVIPETDEEKIALVRQILTGVDKSAALVLVRDIIIAIIAAN